MEIIQINENNISEYYQLLDLFSNEFDDKLNYQNNRPTKEYAKKILTNKSTIILICKADNQIVGGLVAYLLAKFEQERSEIYIYDLAVDSNWRRRRIATSLIYELKSIGKKLGAYLIFVQADKDEDDIPAINLYKKLGVQEDVFHFDITID